MPCPFCSVADEPILFLSRAFSRMKLPIEYNPSLLKWSEEITDSLQESLMKTMVDLKPSDNDECSEKLKELAATLVEGEKREVEG